MTINLVFNKKGCVYRSGRGTERDVSIYSIYVCIYKRRNPKANSCPTYLTDSSTSLSNSHPG